MKKKSNSIPIPFLMLAVYLAVLVAAIAVSITQFDIPIIGTCVFVVLEALLAALLRKVPKGVHVAVVVLQIVAGVYFKKWAFVIAMACCYVAALLLLITWTRDYD